MKKSKKIIFILPLFVTALFYNNTAFAICPICTIAVGAGIGLAHWMKIDDSITGLWIGGLLFSSFLWTITWLSSKKIKFYFRKILVLSLYYGSTIIPLYTMGFIGHDLHKIFGMDKLIFGICVGSILFGLGYVLHNKLKKNNDGRSYFPFQKVVLPILPLLIFSLITYFLI